MGLLVVITGRQGVCSSLGREQRLRFGEEPYRGLPRRACGGQGRHVGQPDREGGAAAALPQAGQLLGEPRRCLLMVARGAGDETQKAQRINRIDRHTDSIEPLHRLLRKETGSGIVALRPGDRAEVEERNSEYVIVTGVPSIGLDLRKEWRSLVVASLADIAPAKLSARERAAPGIVGLLPPMQTLRQQRDRTVRLPAHIGEHPAASKRPGPGPRRVCIRGRLERLIEPALSFVEVAAVVPEKGQSARQAQERVVVAYVSRPCERCPQVVMVAFDHVEQRRGGGLENHSLSSFGQIEEIAGVAISGG